MLWSEGGVDVRNSQKAVPDMNGLYGLVLFYEGWEGELSPTSGATRDEEQALCYAVVAAQNKMGCLIIRNYPLTTGIDVR
jgi:hypothetical protein